MVQIQPKTNNLYISGPQEEPKTPDKAHLKQQTLTPEAKKNAKIMKSK